MMYDVVEVMSSKRCYFRFEDAASVSSIHKRRLSNGAGRCY